MRKKFIYITNENFNEVNSRKERLVNTLPALKVVARMHRLKLCRTEDFGKAVTLMYQYAAEN